VLTREQLVLDRKAGALLLREREMVRRGTAGG
jgi:hypothetical protein